VIKTLFSSVDLSQPKARKTYLVKDINGFKGIIDLWRNNCDLVQEGKCYEITNLKVIVYFSFHKKTENK